MSTLLFALAAALVVIVAGWTFGVPKSIRRLGAFLAALVVAGSGSRSSKTDTEDSEKEREETKSKIKKSKKRAENIRQDLNDLNETEDDRTENELREWVDSHS